MFLRINDNRFMVVLIDRNTVDIYQVYVGIVGGNVDTVRHFCKGFTTMHIRGAACLLIR